MQNIPHSGPETERYNFSRAGHLGPDQMRTLAMMQEQLARSITHTLSAWLRTTFLVTTQSTEQKPFGTFVNTVPEVSYVCSLRLEPQGAHAALHLDLSLALPIVDVLLGGTGRGGEVRDLTEIEESILYAVTEMIVKELSKAWQGAPLEFALEKQERGNHLHRLMAHSEKTVCFYWSIAMPEASGSLVLCLPAVAISSALRNVAALRDRPRKHDAGSSIRMEQRLGQAVFPVSLRLPPVRLPAEELSRLSVGQVLRLPLPHTGEAEVAVGEKAVFRAQPVRSGEHRAARIAELLHLDQGSAESGKEMLV